MNPCTNSSDTQTGPRVSFEVLGKNPFWVYSKNEDGKIGTFKRFQRGQLFGSLSRRWWMRENAKEEKLGAELMMN